jgi:hypothetical protein
VVAFADLLKLSRSGTHQRPRGAPHHEGVLLFERGDAVTLLKEVRTMNRIRTVLIGLMTFWPTLALAEGAGGTIGGSGRFTTRSSVRS